MSTAPVVDVTMARELLDAALAEYGGMGDCVGEVNPVFAHPLVRACIDRLAALTGAPAPPAPTQPLAAAGGAGAATAPGARDASPALGSADALGATVGPASPLGGGVSNALGAQACCVCGQVRMGERRRGGFKCYEHIGVPSKSHAEVVEAVEFSALRDFDIGERLGAGAFGCVYKMRHRTGQEFAVKILDKGPLRANGALESIDSEIEILKQLIHPNVVRIHAVADDPANDRVLIVMEYLGGGPVCNLNPRDGRVVSEQMSLGLFKRRALGITLGLHYLHTKGIVHRDIKPENILVDRADRPEKANVKLADFGVSAVRGGTGAPAGSLFFMPPELFDGSGSTSAATPNATLLGSIIRTVNGQTTETLTGDPNAASPQQDIWALGVTLYLMAFGRLPFFDGSGLWAALRAQVLAANPCLDDDLPLANISDAVSAAEAADLRDMLRGMLQHEPAARMTTAEIIGHPFFNTVRVVKGIPVETAAVRIAVAAVDTTAAATERPAGSDSILVNGADLVFEFPEGKPATKAEHALYDFVAAAQDSAEPLRLYCGEYYLSLTRVNRDNVAA